MCRWMCLPGSKYFIKFFQSEIVIKIKIVIKIMFSKII